MQPGIHEASVSMPGQKFNLNQSELFAIGVHTYDAIDRHVPIRGKILDVKPVSLGSCTCNLQLPDIHAVTTCNATDRHMKISATDPHTCCN